MSTLAACAYSPHRPVACRQHARVPGAIAAMLLAAALCPPALAQQPFPQAPRTLKFATGETLVEAGADGDHVVVKDARGRLTSESWCEAGTFDAYFALFTSLKAAVVSGDRAAVAKLVGYPLRVNGKTPVSIRSAAALGAAYDKVFTPQVVAAVRQAEPAAVFCRNGQGMLGDGVVWADAAGGPARLAVVNR